MLTPVCNNISLFLACVYYSCVRSDIAETRLVRRLLVKPIAQMKRSMYQDPVGCAINGRARESPTKPSLYEGKQKEAAFSPRKLSFLHFADNDRVLHSYHPGCAWLSAKDECLVILWSYSLKWLTKFFSCDLSFFC